MWEGRVRPPTNATAPKLRRVVYAATAEIDVKFPQCIVHARSDGQRRPGRQARRRIYYTISALARINAWLLRRARLTA